MGKTGKKDGRRKEGERQKGEQGDLGRKDQNKLACILFISGIEFIGRNIGQIIGGIGMRKIFGLILAFGLLSAFGWAQEEEVQKWIKAISDKHSRLS